MKAWRTIEALKPQWREEENRKGKPMVRTQRHLPQEDLEKVRERRHREAIATNIHTVIMEYMGHTHPEEMELMVGTVAAESGFTQIIQLRGGPARGIFQIEPRTARDNYENYLRFRQREHRYHELMAVCFSLGSAPFFVPSDEDIEHLLTVNNTFSTIHARIKYLRDPEPIPANGRIKEIAEYYKRVFNTAEGKGSAEKFLEAWFHYDCATLCGMLKPYAKS